LYEQIVCKVVKEREFDCTIGDISRVMETYKKKKKGDMTSDGVPDGVLTDNATLISKTLLYMAKLT
jgi:hypothetical protein